MLNLHLLECTVKGYDHISDLLLAKYWVITGCKYYHCESLVELTFPGSITKIEKFCFTRCIGLRSIVIPEGCESIGNCAFMKCEGLKNVKIPMSVTYIGDHAFEDCKNLNYVHVPNKNAVIGYDAFNFDVIGNYLRNKYRWLAEAGPKVVCTN